MRAKTIFFITLVLFACTAGHQARSAAITDIYSTFSGMGDQGNAIGGGLSIRGDSFLNKYINNLGIFLSSYALYNANNIGEPFEVRRLFFPAVAGINYYMPVMNLPLKCGVSAACGAAYIQKQGPDYNGVFVDPSRTQTDTAIALHAEFLAGVEYHVSQVVGFFLQAGYHYTDSLSDDIAAHASGFQFNFGLCLTIWGNNRELEFY